jgi:hypothetical protein
MSLAIGLLVVRLAPDVLEMDCQPRSGQGSRQRRRLGQKENHDWLVCASLDYQSERTMGAGFKPLRL